MSQHGCPTITSQIERHLSQGDLQAAGALARLALCEPSLHHESLVWDAIIKLGLGHHRGAFRSVQRAALLLPRRSELHGLLGAALAALGEYRLAARSYTRALERDPRNVNIRANYLHALTALSDPEALVQSRRLLAEADSPAVLAAAVRTLVRAGAGPIGRCRLRQGRIEGCFWDRSGSPAVELVWSGGCVTVIPAPPPLDPPGTDGVRPAAVFDCPWPEGAETVRVRTAGGDDVPGSPLRRGPAADTTRPVREGTVREGTEARIDVIIPVYKDYAATAECLRSVIGGTDAAMAEIVVVDDASPDAGIRALLDRLAAEGCITLLRNPDNLGFLKTVNRALRLHTGRDCVLLNADTVVGPGWLGRLRRAAYQAPNIATVTPLSNNGELMSFPRIAEVNPMPSPAGVARIDARAAKANVGQIVDVPVGVGFCLFVRRACLDLIGLLDEQNYDRGYGEESDLCLRAAARGWRNVCATDVYVGHIGTVSFGAEKRGLVLNNLDVLQARYPDYVRSGERFLRDDPLLPHRQRLDRALLAAGSDALLIVAEPGSREKPVLAQVRFREAAGGRRVLWLRPHFGPQGPRFRLEGDGGAGPANLFYCLPGEISVLEGDLKGAGIARIEFHDTGSQDRSVLELPHLLGVPYAVVPHDFALICRDRYGMDPDGRCCAGPVHGTACERCSAVPDPVLRDAGTVASQHAWARDFVSRAAERRVSTRSAARMFAAWCPEAPFTVEPVAVPPPIAVPRPGEGTGEAPDGEPNREPIAVAVVDAEDVAGGFLTLLGMARQAAASDLPLDFVVLGSTIDDLTLIRTGRVAVVGSCPLEDLADAARAHGCQLAMTLAGWPEVDAPGVDRAAATRLPVVGFGIGATAERLEAIPDALVLDPAAGAAAINRTLLVFAGQSEERTV
jgi:GT2 family glycosyltransferase